MKISQDMFVREVIRKQAKLCFSDLQLSQMSGVHINTIHRIKNGGGSRTETVGRISNALNIDIDALIVE